MRRLLSPAILFLALLTAASGPSCPQDAAEQTVRRRVEAALKEELARLRASLLETVRQELGVKQGSLEKALALVTPDLLKKHATYLASDELEGRQAGYEGNVKAGDYIASVMKAAGLAPAGDKDARGIATYFQEFKIEDRRTRNCLGLLEGSDPELKKEFLVIGAHYDHLGTADQSGPPGQRMGRPRDGDGIWNGADDNGSGTTTLLGVIKAFGEGGLKPKRSILFIAFSAEELGLLGSYHYVENPVAPIRKHIFMLNLDMVGRNPDKPVKIDGVGSAEGGRLRKVCEEAVAAAGLRAAVNDKVTVFGGDSDHTPFREKGVPFVFFFSGFHADYHKVTDHADRLAYDNMVKVAGASARIVMALADAEESLAFRTLEFGAPAPLRPRRLLGITPADLQEKEYGDLGLEDGAGGLRVSRVSGSSVAEKAGVKVGDVIVSLNGKALKRGSEQEDLRTILAAIEPGKAVKIGLLRDGKATSLEGTWDK
jgi:hypothetical protein